jgi:uncharacterized protein YqfA (UPF0365 family)
MKHTRQFKLVFRADNVQLDAHDYPGPDLQRNLRDLAMNARINWEVPWAQVPARDKARLFEVVRCSLSNHVVEAPCLMGSCRHAISIRS